MRLSQARQELVDRSCEGVRHMVGKRHRTGFDLDQFAAGDGGSDAGRMRMGMRVGHRRDHQGRTAHPRQTRFHYIAADNTMAFGSARSGLQGIDNEAFQKIAAALWIERLPPSPKFLEVPAIDMLGDLVDYPSVGLLRPSRRIDVGAGRQNQRFDALGPRRRHLDRDRRSRVVTGDNDAVVAQRRHDLVRSRRPGFDGILAIRQGLRIAKSHGIHRDRPVASAQERQHIAELVPGARRLMQQQDGPSVTASRDMHQAGFDADEGTFDHRHYGECTEKGEGHEE